ncbi:MAG: VOC family protein [Phycisphaerales bacterium]|nr:VOC family protein [Phycisphaerales bacterium]
MPRLTRIHETVLYGPDLDAMAAFYTGALGLRQVSRNADRGVVFRITADSVLIAFNPGETTKPHEVVPSHGATGPGHIAFTIPREDLDAWRDHLTGAGLAIEREVTWPTGARSLYVRDPAGNSVELLAGEVWPA